MKEVNLTFIEIEKWIKENKEEIINSKIKKVKQKENIFDFHLYKKINFHLIVVLPYFIFLRKNGIRVEKPTNFSMQLRKFLEKEEIVDIFAKEFERIVIIKTKNYKIIIELFSDGNIILEKDKILAALIQRSWKDREIIIGKEYKFPQSKNLLKLNFLDLLNEIKKCEKNIASFIATDFGLGGYYSNKILNELKIENKICKEINSGELDSIIRKINEIRESKNYSVIENSNIIVDSFSKKQFEKINDAFDFVYNILLKRKERKKEEEVKQKIERIKKEREEKEKEILEKIEKINKKIEIIEKNFFEIQKIIDRINELKSVKIEWEDIKNILRKEFKILKEIDEKNGKIILNFENEEIELQFFKPLREELNLLFNERKKLKEKIKRLKEEIKVEVKEEKKEREEKKWYEKFRWFISSDGFLVLAGKDADSNEILIKKYSREYDYVLHVDIHGSPFVLIRNDKKGEVPLQTLYEAAQFAACYSRAWKLGLNVVDVYCVRPFQLKKDNLPKGSFIVEGKRIWFEKVKLRLSIGVVIENNKIEIRAAPPVALRKFTQYISTIVPGKRSANELAKEIKNHLLSIIPFEFREQLEKINEEEIAKFIPYGMGEIVKI